MEAESLGAGFVDAKDQAGNNRVAIVNALGWVGLSGFDELCGEFLYHVSMIRDPETPRQGQS